MKSGATTSTPYRMLMLLLQAGMKAKRKRGDAKHEVEARDMVQHGEEVVQHGGRRQLGNEGVKGSEAGADEDAAAEEVGDEGGNVEEPLLDIEPLAWVDPVTGLVVRPVSVASRVCLKTTVRRMQLMVRMLGVRPELIQLCWMADDCGCIAYG